MLLNFLVFVVFFCFCTMRYFHGRKITVCTAFLAGVPDDSLL